MRGTQRVGSLLRLCLCAAFLCLVWVLLSTSRADAAERPEPVHLGASVVEAVTSSLPAVAPASAPHGRTAPAPAAAARAAVAPASRASGAVVAPMVERLQAMATATVRAGADELKSVGAAVPVLEAPVVVVADAVVTLAEAAPVVGRDPLTALPLPDPPPAPSPAMPPVLGALDGGAAVSVPTHPLAEQGGSLSTVVLGSALTSLDADLSPTGARTTAVTEAMTLRAGTPGPADLPEPRPSPPTPMPPTHSLPGPGAGSCAGDLAALGPAVVLPSFTTGGSSSSDWRVPRGLPAQPGLRPD